MIIDRPHVINFKISVGFFPFGRSINYPAGEVCIWVFGACVGVKVGFNGCHRDRHRELGREEAHRETWLLFVCSSVHHLDSDPFTVWEQLYSSWRTAAI